MPNKALGAATSKAVPVGSVVVKKASPHLRGQAASQAASGNDSHWSSHFQPITIGRQAGQSLEIRTLAGWPGTAVLDAVEVCCTVGIALRVFSPDKTRERPTLSLFERRAVVILQPNAELLGLLGHF